VWPPDIGHAITFLQLLMGLVLPESEVAWLLLCVPSKRLLAHIPAVCVTSVLLSTCTCVSLNSVWLPRYPFRISEDCWSHWPRVLRRGSAAARLQGFRVRIPPRAWFLSLLSVVCCHVEVSVTGARAACVCVCARARAHACVCVCVCICVCV
jgi:hypothetical protein